MKPTSPGRARSGAQAVERAIRVLDCFADDPAELSLADLAETSGLPKSTTHRIVEALVRGGLLDRDDHANRYRVSLRTAVLGRRALGPLGLDEALPQLYALAAGIKLTVSLGVVDGGDVVTVFSARPPTGFGDEQLPAARQPVQTSAMGKAVLAFDGAPAPAVASSPPRLTAIERELEGVRRQGFALSTRVGDDAVRAVAVPVIGGRRAVWGALGVQARAPRLGDDRVAQIVPGLQQFAGAIGRTIQKRAVSSHS
jgi:DNA-binding IclR family transcriptional regulator